MWFPFNRKNHNCQETRGEVDTIQLSSIDLTEVKLLNKQEKTDNSDSQQNLARDLEIELPKVKSCEVKGELR